jgi:hypothetical protein
MVTDLPVYTTPVYTMPEFDIDKPSLPNMMQYLHDLLVAVVDESGNPVFGKVWIGDLPSPPMGTPVIAQINTTEKVARTIFPGPNPPPSPHYVPVYVRIFVNNPDHNTANIIVRQLEYYLTSFLLIQDTTYGGTCMASEFDNEMATHGSGVSNGQTLSAGASIKILAEFSD